jgi:hypothetical protein
MARLLLMRFGIYNTIVMLSEAKHLGLKEKRPFASLRMTRASREEKWPQWN